MVREEEGEWEEVFDENGYPTGLDRMGFRRNIVDGRTESLDDSWNEVRQALGIPDGTNNRRLVGTDLSGQDGVRSVADEENSSVEEYAGNKEYEGYQADNSDSESTED